MKGDRKKEGGKGGISRRKVVDRVELRTKPKKFKNN